MTKRTKTLLVLWGILIAVVIITTDSEESESPTVSDACAHAFREAANVDALHDTHADLYPAYSACTSIEEWREADRRYPDAIDTEDPINYARTVCASVSNQSELGKTPICKAVNDPPPTDQASSLTASGQFGLLEIPLPVGAELTEKYVPKPGEDADPRDYFKINATQEEIENFYRRELHSRGWFWVDLAIGVFQFRKGEQNVIVIVSNGSFSITYEDDK